MLFVINALGKEPETLEFEAESAEIPALVETGVTGTLHARLDVTPFSADSYLVRGEVGGQLNVECGRCLETQQQPFSIEFNLLMDRKAKAGLEWLEDEDQGVEDYQVRVGADITEIPLDSIIAEQVILNYNFNPLPELDSNGRCSLCGKPAPTPIVEPPKTDRVDPRWAKLEGLKDDSAPNGSKKPGRGKA